MSFRNLVSMSDEYYLHPTAILDDSVQIGERSKIWHFSHIMQDVKIGKDCIVGQNTFMGNSVSIGDGVKIQNNVSVYKGVIIEENVFIGPSVVFTNVLNPRAFIERKDEFKQTIVQKGTSIGANATILCGITLGKYSFVGAGSVVTKSIKDYSIVRGNPARHVGWICVCGKKLRKRGSLFICDTCAKKYAKKNKVAKKGKIEIN